MLHNERSHCHEQPAHCNWRAAPTRSTQRKALAAVSPAQPKINKQKLFLKKTNGSFSSPNVNCMFFSYYFQMVSCPARLFSLKLKPPSVRWSLFVSSLIFEIEPNLLVLLIYLQLYHVVPAKLRAGPFKPNQTGHRPGCPLMPEIRSHPGT